jgi:UDP-glucose 4-epimerase
VRNKLPITVTDPNMTRFMMTLDSAVDLVIFAFEHGHNGDIFVQKAPASTVADIAQSVVELLNSPNHEIKVIGTRHGEKVSEALMSREEVMCAVDLGDYFRVPSDIREHNYDKYYERGDVNIAEFEDYNSHNTNRLNLAETKQLLAGLECLQDRRVAKKS